MLYKYRSLVDFKFLSDIFINQRLYAASYFTLNDPMEGHYRYYDGRLTNELIRKIKDEKERKLKICSLSRDPNNELMWAHYANGHRGLVVGVEIDKSKYDLRPIEYDGPSDVRMAHQNGYRETAIRILSHKLDVWQYEEEERVFVRGENFVYAEIKQVIFGRRMSNQDKSLVSKLVKAVSSETLIETSRVNPL
ncbi:MAG: DUF2971 domain-containing protein [Candidatus Thiodiazotropha taylori]|nr:DUF2971 domain-containing protein [Candidatus Thiodiazotropha taylori]